MAYFRDWFGRSAEDAYTSYDSSKRAINWDKGYDNYSDYFFGKRSGGKASSMKIQDAASLLATMSKVVGIDSSKFNCRTWQRLIIQAKKNLLMIIDKRKL